MRKTTICTFIGLVALCAFISSSHCAAIEPAPNGWLEYTVFFHRLTLPEKRAVMTLAIAYHDAPESSKDPVIFPTNPSRPKAEEIPATLYAKMMNGKIPKDWFSNFVKWLQNHLKITNNSLNLYRNEHSDDLCTEDNEKCYSITDLGQQCCPFG